MGGGSGYRSNRSIPACAGETGLASMPSPIYPVYPRVCGGNPWAVVKRILGNGLSPRVRGKRGARW